MTGVDVLMTGVDGPKTRVDRPMTGTDVSKTGIDGYRRVPETGIDGYLRTLDGWGHSRLYPVSTGLYPSVPVFDGHRRTLTDKPEPARLSTSTPVWTRQHPSAYPSTPVNTRQCPSAVPVYHPSVTDGDK